MSLSSPRTQGPIRRVLSMWHDLRKLEASVVMGLRFRGDDSGECCPSQLANAPPPGCFDFLTPVAVSLVLPQKGEGSGAPEGAVTRATLCEAWCIPCEGCSPLGAPLVAFLSR